MSDYSFLTLDMIMSSNLVPPQYAGQDVRLLYSKSNPTHMGFWFSSGYGHERQYLSFLKEMGFTGQQVRDLPLAYMVDK